MISDDDIDDDGDTRHRGRGLKSSAKKQFNAQIAPDTDFIISYHHHYYCHYYQSTECS